MSFEKQDPIFYAGDTLHRIKQEKIQRAMERAGYDALLLFKAEAVRYVTDFYVKGFRPFMEPEYLVLVPRGGAPAVGHSSGSDDLRIRYKSDIEDTRRLPAVHEWSGVIGEMIGDYGLQNARIGTDFIPFMVCDALRAAFPGISFENAADIWVEITAVKHDLEVDLIRNSVRIADLGMRAAIEAVRPGIREYEVAAEAEYAMRKAGSEMTPFIPAVSSGANASMFERVATEKTIEAGEMVIMDVGAVVKGYTGDLGRTVICGEPTPKQREVYRAAYDSVREVVKAVRPGVTCHEVDRRAREVIEEAGWGRYQHAGNTGHQLGYGLHGDPLIHRDVDVPLVENMVICLEPRVVLPDQPEVGGAHLEDVVVVTKDGAEYLNDTPYDERLLN
ncbi:MAG: Xaa-Pro peptidase family protein [Kiloniellales bacterium]|nr:Xaa-Pro peptidase family protein [Kiloniellales bacterium]